MNKKKYIRNAVAAAILGLTLGACNIAEDDRYIEMPAPELNRTVLLMDFTGQNCVNCPGAHELIEELVNQYGDTALVAVSIHAGGLAISVDRTNFERNVIGLMIEEGQEMNDAFGIASWPMGVVDKINDPSAAINTGEWATAVRNALEQKPGASIKASATFNPSDSTIHITGEALSEQGRKAAMQFWIVENGIVGRQKSKETTIEDYVHNNVLRDVVFSVKDGEPMDMAPEIWCKVTADVKTKYTDKERWNVENLSVVAFVFEGTNILNTVRVPVEMSE